MQEKRTVDEEEFNPEEVVTIDVLAQAIANGISRPRMRMSIEEAKLTAEHVLNFFGFYNRIIDNVLEPEDRDTFYMLEDLGILTTEREETTLHDGREWRIQKRRHHWLSYYWTAILSSWIYFNPSFIRFYLLKVVLALDNNR